VFRFAYDGDAHLAIFGAKGNRGVHPISSGWSSSKNCPHGRQNPICVPIPPSNWRDEPIAALLFLALGMLDVLQREIVWMDSFDEVLGLTNQPSKHELKHWQHPYQNSIVISSTGSRASNLSLSSLIWQKVISCAVLASSRCMKDVSLLRLLAFYSLSWIRSTLSCFWFHLG